MDYLIPEFAMINPLDSGVIVPPAAHSFWPQFCRHKGALTGVAILGLIVFAVIAGPWVYTVDPHQINVQVKNSGSTLEHPMGTDNLGRDTLARLLLGGRLSLSVGLISVLIAVLLGSVIGVLAGYFKRLDGPLMRLTDLFFALPLLPLLLVAVMLFRDPLRSVFGPEAGLFILIVFAIGLTSWMQTARVVRSDVLALKHREFVKAAESIGTPDRHIVTRHIVPGVVSPIIVSGTLGLANALMTESALSFLGLGFPSDFPSWGRLLYDGANYITLTPERVIWPGCAISLTILSVNYIGDGWRDAQDPKRRVGKRFLPL